MKLRSRLFLSSSALLTVALVGLLLGMFSVLQLTQVQSQAMTRNLQIIDASLGLRQELGKQVILLLAEDLDREALKASDQQFKVWLQRAAQSATDASDRQAVAEIERSYASFDDLLAKPLLVRRELLSNDSFGRAIEALRDRINAVQLRYVKAMEQEEARARERAWLIAGLLGMIGLAVLVIGFVTAHSIAQRFGRPIEVLAQAADQIGQGDFQVTLPLTPVAEMSALSQRFGLMAEALREFKNSDLEALQAEQQRLQAVLDSIDDGLLIFDCAGRVEHINPVARRQLGWGVEQLGQTLDVALNRADLAEQLHRVLQGESLDETLDDLQVQIDGESRLLAYSLSGVSHNEGRLMCAVMVLRDVTEQRAFERVRSEFVLRASHELRTPVTGMLMAFALLQERLQFAAESREADLLNTVDEEMQRLLRLINDLLNFSRYQNGLQTLELSACALEPLLLQTQQRFGAQAAELQVSLACEVHGELPDVQIDLLQIERVLDNLIGNALRHSHPGGHIRLQARQQDDRVVLSVEDNGEGIPYRQQTRIFEPFVQVSRKKGGAGLGLALCKEIVQLHGGQIGVHSRAGQGAQFYVALPV
ncbi:MAG: KinB sensor domain-containing domain [Pseudomonas sp.]|uniref:KinB sensor domain-containing domain n=1 Tax=Pseudomonas sp. TaxID=306 RepID=UPI00271C40E4|nr:KinB sensor domain-containing domain [Pseudomonas sp.]MDO9617556.1 KinB sensor domain-containing domain [Pseudomonas sp.]MDP2443813.1 KinB sensor domain-containing domain [Pseudomonas sp.]